MKNKDGCYVETVESLYRLTGREIAERLRRLQGNPSESEYRSWENSIPILVDVLHRAKLDALTLVLEYQTPIGNRIDAILLGERKDTGKPLVLVIELKQWSSIGDNTDGRQSTVSVCVSKAENRFEDRLHPVQQTLTYAKHLRMNHSNVANGKMEVRCCQFLHNFEDKDRLFRGSYQPYAALQQETYGKGEKEKLAADLNRLFSPDPRPDVVDQFLNGTYVLGQVSFGDLKRVLERKENAAMLDDQIEVNRTVCGLIDRLSSPHFAPRLVIISGPPGTGKTVVGLHAVYAYCRKYGSTGKNDGKCLFTLPRSRTLAQVITGASGVAPVYLDAVPSGRDMVIVDEAHRIEQLNTTMTDLFRKAKMIVVLQDDRQRIRLTEEGTLENFRQFAEQHSIRTTVCSLASQKRAGYLGSYVSDLDQLLYGRRNRPLQRRSALELRCWDDLNALDGHLHRLASAGRHVKWYAPFCWPWSKSVSNMDIVIPQGERAFQKAWNPIREQYHWYLGETAEDLDRVGCIYTAQGLEFDDVGVIWWNDLRWEEETQEWHVDLDACCDPQFLSSVARRYGGRLEGDRPPWRVQHNGRRKDLAAFLEDSHADRGAITELVLNTYRVLLTRAKSSVHIWFADRATEEHVRTVLGF